MGCQPFGLPQACASDADGAHFHLSRRQRQHAVNIEVRPGSFAALSRKNAAIFARLLFMISRSTSNAGARRVRKTGVPFMIWSFCKFGVRGAILRLRAELPCKA